MTDDQFQRLCNTFGFAPSRALREMLDAATRQAVLAEREACAKVLGNGALNLAAAIRARSNT